jgi:hypothetical protein
MNVKPGVPFVKHPNTSIRSDIYSQLLIIPDLKINIPENGQKLSVFVPMNQQSNKLIIKNLLKQIGFNGLISINETNSPEGTEFITIIEY